MKEKILSILFVLFLSSFLVVNIFVKDIDISISERRKLTQFPEITLKSIFDKSFMEDFDSYTVDQFVLRDKFRNIKSKINYNLFQKLDNNGLYIVDDFIFKSEYPTNLKSIENFVYKINSIAKYLNRENKVYYAIIPDKNYYINDNRFLNIDYDLLYSKLNDINYNYIELRDVLALDDFYKTDTHWKQENLEKVVKRLGSK